MLGALESELGGRATWSRPEGGYFLWLDFGDGVDAGELLTRATEAGVTFVRGADFFPGDGGASAARLRVLATSRPSAIAEGVRAARRAPRSSVGRALLAPAAPPALAEGASAAPSSMLRRISQMRRVLTVKKTKLTSCFSLLTSRNTTA